MNVVTASSFILDIQYFPCTFILDILLDLKYLRQIALSSLKHQTDVKTVIDLGCISEGFSAFLKC